jgi:hypothetical protein
MQRQMENQRIVELARQMRTESAGLTVDDTPSEVTQSDGVSDARPALSEAYDVSQLGSASEHAQAYGLEDGIDLPAAQPGQPYFSPLRRTLSGVASIGARTATVDSYLSPRPAPEPEPELDSAPMAPAPLRDLWLVAMDSARDIKHLDPAAKADRLLGLQKRAWEQASSLAEVIASPKKAVEDEPPPEDRYSKLDGADRKAVDCLGWTPETFNEGRAPSVLWETLSEEERRMAMMIGYDGEAWDEAVKEQREDDELREAEREANDPVRHARAAKDVDMLLMELASSVTPG